MTTAQDEPQAEWLHDRRVTAASKDGSESGVVDGPACLVCGDTKALPAFKVQGISQPIVVCADCGLGQYRPPLDDDQIKAAYPPEYYGHAASKFRGVVEFLVQRVATRHINFLTAGLPANARVLDIGCGRGVLLTPLADRGFQVFGVEINDSATQGSDSRAEIRIASRLGDAQFPADFFDEIIIWHVLEHVEDPSHTIEECRRILRPGGRLIVAVPNFSSLQARWSGPAWFHLDAPRHLFHFPLAGLQRLVRDRGFEIRSTHHFSLRQNPFGWIQSALNRYTDLPPNALYRLMHQREEAKRSALGLSTRVGLWLLLAVSAPLAIAMSVVTAFAKSGATVHIVAIRKSERTS